MLRTILASALLAVASAAQAQTAPSPAEVAAYRGLHHPSLTVLLLFERLSIASRFP